jgi:hypothetical protein
VELKQIIKVYQELANNAWPCNQHFFVKGWDVRVSEGYTQRANSVLPISYFGLQPEEDIALVEQIYQKMKLPKTIFQIPDYTDPSNLDLILSSRGYKLQSKTSVMSAKLKDLSLDDFKNVDSFITCDQDLNGQWFDFKKSFSPPNSSIFPLFFPIFLQIRYVFNDIKILFFTVESLSAFLTAIPNKVLQVSFHKRMISCFVIWSRSSDKYQSFIEEARD